MKLLQKLWTKLLCLITFYAKSNLFFDYIIVNLRIMAKKSKKNGNSVPISKKSIEKKAKSGAFEQLVKTKNKTRTNIMRDVKYNFYTELINWKRENLVKEYKSLSKVGIVTGVRPK